jgi:small subunit ribosomal protein S16
MLVIRLTRVGKKKQPSYRIVVQEKSKDPWGKAIEIIGNYNPRTKALVIKEDRVKHWIGQGAHPSPSLHNILLKEKLISGEKRRAAKGGGMSGAKEKAPEAAKEAAAPAPTEGKKEEAAS